MKDRIVEIIEELSGYDLLDGDPNIDLLENEILDSVAFIELINTLEDEYDIEIQPTQVKPDTWRRVENIVGLVESLCG